MFIAILGGLGASIAWAAADIFIKKSVDRIDSVLNIFLFRLGTFVCALPLLIFYPDKPELDVYTILIIVAFALFQLIITGVMFLAFRYGKVSLVTPTISSYPVLVALLSFIVFGERFTSWKIISVILVYLGILIVGFGELQNERKKAGGKNKFYGLFFAIVVMISYAWYFPAFDNFIDRDGWPFIVFLGNSIGVALIVPAIIYKYGRGLRISNDKKQNRTIFTAAIAGVLNGLGNIALTVGFGLAEDTSVTVAIASSTSAVTVLFAYIFLKERLAKIQYLGIALVILTIIVFSILSV